MRHTRTGLLLAFLFVPGSVGASSPSLSPQVGATWSIAAPGAMIGLSGIVLARNGASHEMYMGGTWFPFGSDRYWYALRYSPGTQSYDVVYTSEVLPASIARIGLASLYGDRRAQIVVALQSGQVLVYDQITRAILPGFTVPASIDAMAIADLDGDGRDEIVLSGSAGLLVYAGDGTSLWGVPSASGVDIAVGQMDDDPSLEIATTDGRIVDVATQSVQWTFPGGFGVRLRCGDIDGDGRDELIAADQAYAVHAYDVEAKLEHWTITTPSDVGAIALVDTDCDGQLDVVIGDGQPSGNVSAFDGASRALKWQIPNPESGVTWIEFGDVDGDGKDEVVWGAGSYTTGPDRLYVGNPVTESIEWHSDDLVGPFLGPELGDVDGDGQPELVFVTRYSDAQYAGARIFVLDGQTLRVRAVSDPLPEIVPIPSLILKNVDADPALEIVLAGGAPYDGTVQVYGFTPPNTFTLKWQNDPRPFGSWFFSFDLGAAAGDGVLKVLVGGGRAHTGADGTFLYVYDYATGVVDWTSTQLGGYWDNVQAVAIVSGGAGAPDLLGIVENGALYAFDGATHAALPVVPGAFTAMRAAPFSGVRTAYLGDASGKVYRYERNASGYALAETFDLGLSAIDGITLSPDGGFLIGSSGRLRFYSDLNAAPVWTTLDFGDSFGSHATRGVGLHARVLSGGLYGVFEVGAPLGVSGISPASGDASGGAALAVQGSSFASGASAYLDGAAVNGVVVQDDANLTGAAPALPPGTLADLVVLNADGTEGALLDAFFANFLDVGAAHPFHAGVEGISRKRVTAGCGAGNYCPAQPVTRAQMAVFLVRAGWGSSFPAPRARGDLFSDVACHDFAADEIEWLARTGVTAGCGSGAYCGGSPVTRAQMAVFLLKTLEGGDYVPPPAKGVFADVPASDPFAPWIEELASRGITAGCGGGNYCPGLATNRGQMAVFLTLTFP